MILFYSIRTLACILTNPVIRCLLNNSESGTNSIKIENATFIRLVK